MSTLQSITEIALADLHESPSNPRKRFSEAYLQELAADIKSHGRVLSPMLVRPRVPALFAGDPDATVGYEIVFGHCRFRAAGIAGLATAPCMVRSMTDLEVRRAQISENLQRRDVHPIEEAEGFQALIDEHGETADSIALSLGGPDRRSYVYSRLKLLQACPEIRTACLDGKIGSEVALRIARLRHPKLQQRALGYIEGKYIKLEDGGQKSLRQITDLLNEHFTLDLKQAIFPLEQTAEFMHISGSCTACPKRSGNAPEYADIANVKKAERWSRQNLGPDVCTDPDCFQTKKVAWLKVKADQLRDKHRGHKEVIDGNKARNAIGADGKVKGGYVELSKAKPQYDKAVTTLHRAKHPGVHAPAIYVIQNPRDGKCVEALKISELVAAGVREPEKAVTKPTSGGSRDWEAEARERDARAEARTKRHTAWLHRVRSAAAGCERSAFDLRLIARVLLDGFHDSQDEDTLLKLYGMEGTTDELAERIDTMTRDQVALLMLDCALIGGIHDDGWQDKDELPDGLARAAAHYGVPMDEPEPETSPQAAATPVVEPKFAVAWPFPTKPTVAPTPSPAAQAQGKAASKPKRPAARADGQTEQESAQLAFEAAADEAAEEMQSSQTTPAVAGGAVAEI